MSQQVNEMVIRKSVTVSAPVERAFSVFTEEIGAWWPLRTHAVDTEGAVTVVFDPRPGGRLFERTSSGEEHIWGKIEAWEPPTRLVYTWHPGRGDETAQEVEVTFSPDGDGTRVDLAHSGWEKLGGPLDDTLASYQEGWGKVLGLYAEAAEAS